MTFPDRLKPRSGWLAGIYAVVLAIVGAILLVGAVILTAAGGSLYYLIAGAMTLASGVLIWRGERRGGWVYGALLAITLAWSI